MTKDILVIDSDMKNFYDICRYFKKEIIDIHYADSINEAFQKIQFNHFCLIVLYLSDTDTNKCDMILALRKRNSTPILALLDDHDVSEEIEILKNGADDVLKKTVDMEMLTAKME